MHTVISSGQLKSNFGQIIGQIKKGTKFTVSYRNSPAFEIFPIIRQKRFANNLKSDPIYHSGPLGRSSTGDIAVNHDKVLYQ